MVVAALGGHLDCPRRRAYFCVEFRHRLGHLSSFLSHAVAAEHPLPFRLLPRRHAAPDKMRQRFKEQPGEWREAALLSVMVLLQVQSRGEKPVFWQTALDSRGLKRRF